MKGKRTVQYKISEICQRFDVSRATLIRWESKGLLTNIERDWRGWRVYTESDLNNIEKIMKGRTAFWYCAQSDFWTIIFCIDNRTHSEWPRSSLSAAMSRPYHCWCIVTRKCFIRRWEMLIWQKQNSWTLGSRRDRSILLEVKVSCIRFCTYCAICDIFMNRAQLPESLIFGFPVKLNSTSRMY